MKTALVHDWLVSLAGGEKVLELILKAFPSPIYTLLQDPKNLQASFFSDKTIFSSFIQSLPFAKKHYQKYLPLFPFAIEQFDLSEYELILSSSHCVAKGVLTHVDQMHICYCHTPMRYAWDLYFDYINHTNLSKGFKARLAQFFLHYLRMWDLSSSSRVDAFIANSHFVKRRIKKLYGKEALVIYPPVDTKFFLPNYKKEEFYLTASRLVPYKKVDLIVEAFNSMPDKKLVVIGEGQGLNKIKKMAKPNIEILGYQSSDILKKYLQKAKAFVFAAIEDFGILPIEAQACATPVIAYNKGGIKETIINKKTGVFFEEQNVLSIIQAIKEFEKIEFDLQVIHEHAQKFSKENFSKEFKKSVIEMFEKHKESL